MAVVASFSAHILSLAVPLALVQAYDRLIPNQAYATTFLLGFGVLLAIIGEAVLRYGRSILFANIGAVFESRMTLRVLNHVMQSESRHVHGLGTPVLSDALRAVTAARDNWTGSAAAGLHELPFVVIYIALIGYIGGWLALIPFLLTIAALAAAYYVSRSAMEVAQEVNAAEIHQRSLLWGIFGGIVEVKTMAAEAIMTRQYRDAVAETLETHARQDSSATLIRENGHLLGQLSTILIVGFGAGMIIDGTLTTGGLAACSLIAGRSIAPAMSAFSYLNQRSRRNEAEQKIEEVLSLPLAPLWQGSGERMFTGGEIRLAGEAVAGGEATIPFGRIVRIDAPDPLTETAVLHAVARLDDALGLTVSYDGLPGIAYDSVSLKHHIALANATTPLVTGTLLDNLTLFSPQYEPDALRMAQRLGLDSFVDSLPDGLMTPVGAVGAEIVSQGLTVRIGLIRALVRRPAILCLDHIGGALDLDGTKRLMEVLRQLKGHITILICSNNPTMLELADQTVRIERRVVHG
ncbi:MAG: ABC transporter transmembrane domain-containing protein [Parvibaculaceae bacterium]|nr:ABC transporter transmembrane domain-containing protein [Parvibaculaceae bacterium]